MPVDPIVSFARNREDVVLWRALSGVTGGRYVEVGADPVAPCSVTRALGELGWSGLTVEAVAEHVVLHQVERPGDTHVQGAFGATDGPARTLGDILDEHGWREAPTHVLVVDAAGAEAAVLEDAVSPAWRPWVLVVRATAPDSATPTHEGWEPRLLDAGYVLRLFDGVSRFYVAAEHDDDLGPALSYPACSHDAFVDARLQAAEADRDAALEQVVHWRTVALTTWADALAAAAGRGLRGGDEAERLRAEIAAIQQTLSWRITRPLRSAKVVAARVRSR